MKIRDGFTNKVHLADDRFMVLCGSCVESPEIVPLTREITCRKCQFLIEKEKKAVNPGRNGKKS
jgi:hypothetical protein